MGKYSLAMFEGEERWSRNCGSGIGLSNYKNVFRDDILVGNWQEDLYGNRINPDTTHAEQEPAHYLSVTMNDFDRKQIDPDRARGGSREHAIRAALWSRTGVVWGYSRGQRRCKCERAALHKACHRRGATGFIASEEGSVARGSNQRCP